MNSKDIIISAFVVPAYLVAFGFLLTAFPISERYVAFPIPERPVQLESVADDPEFISPPPVPDDTMDALLHDICMHNLCLNEGCCRDSWTVECQGMYEECTSFDDTPEYPYPAEPSGPGWITPLLQELHRLCLEQLCLHTDPPCCPSTWSIQCQEQYRDCMSMADCTDVICDIDPFCCNHEWDDWCQAQYVDCLFNNDTFDLG